MYKWIMYNKMLPLGSILTVACCYCAAKDEIACLFLLLAALRT